MRVVDTGTDIQIKGLLRSITCDSIDNAVVQIFEENIFVIDTVTDSTGAFSVVIPSNGVAGTRNFKVVYAGDDNYNGTESVDIIVEVHDIPVLDNIVLSVDKFSLQLGERFTLTANVKSQYGAAFDSTVVFKNNDEILGTVETVNGKALLKITPNMDMVYNITAISQNIISNEVNVTVETRNIFEVLADLNEKIDSSLDLLQPYDFYFTNEEAVFEFRGEAGQGDNTGDNSSYSKEELDMLLTLKANNSDTIQNIEIDDYLNLIITYGE